MKRFFKLSSVDNKTMADDDDRSRRGSDRSRSGSVAPTNWTSLLGLHMAPSPASTEVSAAGRQYDAMPSSNRDKLCTKLHKACWSGDLDKVRRFIRKIDVNDRDSELRTPLHLAVARGHKDIIWFLLGMKAMPNLPDCEGNTPLLKAIQTGRIDIVHFLLDRGANPQASNLVGHTGLHLAAMEGLQDVAFALLRKGATVNAIDQNGCTPLFVATSNGEAEMAETLLRHGASVNIADKHRRTCLMIAGEVGSISMVRLFLQYGADVTASSNVGLTALDIAQVAGHDACVCLIAAKAPKPDAATVVVADFRRTSIVDNTTDFENVDLDSWNDDDDDMSVGLPHKKKIVPVGLDLSKFMDDGSDLSLSQKSVGSQKSAVPESTLPIVPIEQQVTVVASPQVLPGLPPAPAKPKRAASLESCESVVEESFEPEVQQSDLPSPTALTNENETSVPDQAVRDLMAELGLSDVSQFSSSITTSARDEDTDHDLDSTIEDVIAPKIVDTEPPTSPIAEKASHSEAEPVVTEAESKENSLFDEPLKESSKFEVSVDNPKTIDEDSAAGRKSVTEFASAAKCEISLSDGIFDESSKEAIDDEVESSKSECEKIESLEPAAPSVDGGTLGRIDTLQGVDEVWLRNPSYAVAIDLGVSSDSQPSSSTAENNGRDVSDNSGGIFRAELVKVNSKEDLLTTSDVETPSNNVLADAATMTWDQIWLRVCGKLLVDGSDSVDDVTIDEENNVGSIAMAISKDVPSNVPSSAEDESTTSLNEDHTYKLLITTTIADPTPTTAVHHLATMVQHLRRMWLKEKELSKNMQEKIVGLKATVHGMEEIAVEARSMLTSRIGRVAELEHELESARSTLHIESERIREALLELERRQTQLGVAEARYIDEASARQKAELRARAAELEAEKSQLALMEARDGGLNVADAMTQAGYTDPVIQEENVCVQGLLESEVLGYKDQMDGLRSLLRTAEDESEHLKTELPKLNEEIAYLRVHLATVSSERDVAEEQKAAMQFECDSLTQKLWLKSRHIEEVIAKADVEQQKAIEERQSMEARLRNMEDKNACLEADVASSATELQSLNADCSNLKAKLELGESWMDMARNQYESGLSERWEAALKSVRSDYETAEQLLIDRNENLNATVSRLQLEVQAANDRDNDFRRDLEAVKHWQTELRSSSADLNELNSHLEMQFKELGTEIRTVVAELVRCQNELKAVKEQEAFAERRAAESEAAREDECRRLFAELDSVKRDRADFASQLADANLPFVQLEMALEEQKAEMRKAQEVIRNLEEEVKKLESVSKSKCNVSDTRQVVVDNACLRIQCPCSNCKSLSSPPRINLVNCSEDVQDKNVIKGPTSVRDPSRAFWNELRNDLGQEEMDEERWDDRPLRVCSKCSLTQKTSIDAVDHRNCVDRDQVDLMKQRLELQAREEMNRKLSQINDILEERSNSRFRRDQRLRDGSEPRGVAYLGAIRELQGEIGRLHRSLEHRDMSHVSLEQHCARLCDLMEAKRCVKSKLKRRDELDDVVRDVAEDVRGSGFHRQILRPFVPMYDFRKHPADVLHSTAFLPSPTTTFRYYNNDIRGADDRLDFGGFNFRAEFIEHNDEPSLEPREPSSMNFDLPMPDKPTSDYAAPSRF